MLGGFARFADLVFEFESTRGLDAASGIEQDPHELQPANGQAATLPRKRKAPHDASSSDAVESAASDPCGSREALTYKKGASTPRCSPTLCSWTEHSDRARARAVHKMFRKEDAPGNSNGYEVEQVDGKKVGKAESNGMQRMRWSPNALATAPLDATPACHRRSPTLVADLCEQSRSARDCAATAYRLVRGADEGRVVRPSVAPPLPRRAGRADRQAEQCVPLCRRATGDDGVSPSAIIGRDVAQRKSSDAIT